MSNYRINEVLLNAQELGEKVILVEGVDDVQLYENLFHNEGYIVLAIENVETITSESGECYQPGCHGVKIAIEDITSHEDGNTDLIGSNMLGIIDKDVSDYRGEVVESDIVVNLRHYAIENHFIEPQTVYLLLKNYSKSAKLIDEELADKIFSDILVDMEILYLITLDSLKGALDSDYQAIFGYSSPDACYKNESKLNSLLERKDELEEFSNAQGLSYGIDLLKNTTKGKWALQAFCEFLPSHVSRLVEKCKNNQIKQCQFCATGKHHHCLYRLNDGVNNKTLKSNVYNFYSIDSLKYIHDDVNSKFA